MEWTTRALMLAALLAATAAGAQPAAAAQRVQFSGGDSTFAVVAAASAQVTPQPQFLRVTLEPGVIRSTAFSKQPGHVTGYRINLAYTLPSGEWDMLRKSERVPLDIVLDRLDAYPVAPRTLLIPIDGVDTLKDKWLVFEVDVDGTPPMFTYSHSAKLNLEGLVVRQD
jgi:hypothetical protein